MKHDSGVGVCLLLKEKDHKKGIIRLKENKRLIQNLNGHEVVY